MASVIIRWLSERTNSDTTHIHARSSPRWQQRQCEWPGALRSGLLFVLSDASRDDQRNVMLLLAAAEPLSRGNNRLEQRCNGEGAAGSKRLQQAELAELLPIGPGGFRDAVSVEHQRIAWGELHFRSFDLPFFEEPQHGTGGVQPFHPRLFGSRTVRVPPGPQQQRREVSAVHVAHSATAVVVVTKEKRGVTAVCGVLVE